MQALRERERERDVRMKLGWTEIRGVSQYRARMGNE